MTNCCATKRTKNLISLSGLEPGRDIEIKFVGLREGEKLKEDMLLEKEKANVTRHNKIGCCSSWPKARSSLR